MKKSFALLIILAMLCAVMSSCKITLIDAESKDTSNASAVSDESGPTVVDDGETVILYTGCQISEGMYRFVAAKQKGLYAYVYKQALGIDFDSNPDYWDYIYTDNQTFAEFVRNEAINLCKSMAIYESLCDSKNIEHASDEDIEEYIDSLATNFDSKDAFIEALAEVGCTVETVKKYYDIYSRAATLKATLTGDGGALNVTDADADAWFEDYVQDTYVKVDALYFSFYESDYVTKYISKKYTDDDAAQYFLDNYIKYQYITYDPASKVLAKNCLADLKAGTATVADKLGESSDNTSEALIRAADANYQSISAIDVGGFGLIETDEYIMVIARVKASTSDMTASIRDECKWMLSCADVETAANSAYDRLKDGTYNNFDEIPSGEFYSLHGGEVLVKADTLSEEFFKTVKYDTDIGRYGLFTMIEDGTETGIYVYKKLAVTTDDCADAKQQAISDYKDSKFDDYINEFVDAATADETKINEISINELKSMLLW